MKTSTIAIYVVAILTVTPTIAQEYGQSPTGQDIPEFGLDPNGRNILWCDEALLSLELTYCEGGIEFVEIFLDRLIENNPEEPSEWNSDDLERARGYQQAISQQRSRCGRIRQALEFLQANPDRRC